MGCEFYLALFGSEELKYSTNRKGILLGVFGFPAVHFRPRRV